MPAGAVPSFSRQTGKSCSSCHTVYPELTPYGRWFKLTGYTSGDADTLVEKVKERTVLDLPKTLPLSAMVLITDAFSNTTTTSVTSRDKRGALDLPAQISLFLAGKISPNLGSFIQITYDDGSGVFHGDNMELRYARKVATIHDNDLFVGATLNNNPTVQDAWHSTPAWGYPYAASPFQASPSTSPFIASEGGNVGGLGVYAYLDNWAYVEMSGYRSSPQGLPTGTNIWGVAPYYRVALIQERGNHSIEVGTYGMYQAQLADSAAEQPRDSMRDKAFDAQYQFITDDHQASLQASWLREDTAWNAEYAGGTGSVDLPSTYLKQTKVTASYYFRRTIGLVASYSEMKGTQDGTVYSTFADFRPDSIGAIYELVYVPWRNTRFSAQYSKFNKIDGSTDKVPLSNENTLGILAWLAF